MRMCESRMKIKGLKLIVSAFVVLTLFFAEGSVWAFTTKPTLNYTGTATSTESAGSVSLTLDTITTIDRANYLNGDFTDINNVEETIIEATISLSGAVAGDCSTAALGYFFFPAIATMAITGQDSFVYMTADVSYLPPGSSVLFLYDGFRWLLYPPTLDANDPTLLNLSNIQLYTDSTHPSRYIEEFANSLISASSDIAGMTMILTPLPGSGTLCDGGTVSTFSVQGLVDGVPPLQVPTMTEWGMIIFMVLAGFGSIYFMRRKRRAES